MLHTNNPIIKHKAGLLNLAQELGMELITWISVCGLVGWLALKLSLARKTSS